MEIAKIKKKLLWEDFYTEPKELENCKFCIPPNTKDELTKKQEAIATLYKKMAEDSLRNVSRHKLTEYDHREWSKFEELLLEEGEFKDLSDTVDGAYYAIQRLTVIAVYGHHFMNHEVEDTWKKKDAFMRALTHYCTIETRREDKKWTRFHKSVFMIPRCCVNIYFALHPLMERIENAGGTEIEEKAQEALFQAMLQCYTLPLRSDETDQHPGTVERFRKNVWWVGGNALSYRPVFETAICLRSVELLDVIVYVSVHALSATSQTTRQESFWSEGICADGWGWGHGPQMYNNGYPTNSISDILWIFSYMKETPWIHFIKTADWNCLSNYIKGITWATWRDCCPPLFSRMSFIKACVSAEYHRPNLDHSAKQLVAKLDQLRDLIPQAVMRSLDEFYRTDSLHMKMEEDVVSEFMGNRYFFNNDALVSKARDCYLYFNMASSRCDGVECAKDMGDTRNFFQTDGACLIYKYGNEYEDAMGTWQVSHFPGTTERNLSNRQIIKETNWNGYNSKHNFAAGISDHNYACAGFIYEKNEERKRDGAGKLYLEYTKEMCGIRAYKSCFISSQLFLFLGAGITDCMPSYGENVITTINNTLLTDDFRVINAKGEKTSEESQHIYVRNHGMLYGIYPDAKDHVMVQAEARKTHWEDLNIKNKGFIDYNVSIFELGINHGKAPSDSKYAYFITTDQDRCPSEIEEDFTILSNTQKVQAVFFPKENVIEAMFYEACELFEEGIRLKVSHPCSLLLRRMESRTKIIVADPLQDTELKSILVDYDAFGESNKIEVILPNGMFTGAQAEKIVEDLK